MTFQAITLNLPDTVYEQLRSAAEKTHRPINDLLVETLTAIAPVVNTASESMRSALAQLTYLNDAALWQAARATMLPNQRDRLQQLHDQQQQQSLSVQEQAEEQALLALYRETILVRAQAALLLKLRGYSVIDPNQFSPIE